MSTSKTSAVEFYDNFIPKMTYDFLRPNKRIASAISFVLEHLSQDADRVLDIGCGLGWSSKEFARNTKAEVVAVDLSPKLIELAVDLFGTDHARYEVKNVNDGFDEAKTFSSVVMIDVFEHIEKENREKFILDIKRMLSPQFQIFFTCPTIAHQNYLREFKPEGLQPVDEDVSREDIDEIAKTLGGELVHFEELSVFREMDYFHAIISNFEATPAASFQLLSKEERVKTLVDFKRNVLKKEITFWDKWWFRFPKHGHDLISGGRKSKKIKGW
ncbi:MAG: class I SAM-dependent methyltransferase [Bacteroidota bacterium]